MSYAIQESRPAIARTLRDLSRGDWYTPGGVLDWFAPLLAAMRKAKGGGTVQEIEPKLGNDDIESIAVERYSTDCDGDPRLIRIAPRLWIEDDGYSQHLICADCAADIISDWDFGPDGIYRTLEDALVAYGLDPDIVEADDDYTGPCRIWVEPNYLPGTCGAPKSGWVCVDDDGGDIKVFDTRAAAQDYVEEYYNAPSCYTSIKACNVFSHGQYAADTLTIVEA